MPPPTPPPGARTRNDGTRGEQDAGFLLGDAGYFIVDGPSGAGGHAANAHGPDGVAYSPLVDDLIVYDVKYYLSAPRNAGKATGITINLDTGWFDALIAKVRQIPDMPAQAKVLSRLQAARNALAAGSAWPTGVRVAVAKTSGNVQGISPGLAAMGISYIDLTTDPTIRKSRRMRVEVMGSIRDNLARLRQQYDLHSGEHELQARQLYANPSPTNFIAFAGFWTNRLFNTDIPPTFIWNQAYAEMAATARFLHEGDAKRAMLSLLRARIHYLYALRRYVRWKDGVEGAGRKMQIAIGAVAVAAVVVAVGAFVLAPAAASGAGAGASAAATEQTLARIGTVMTRADTVFRVVDAAAVATEAQQAAELAAMLEELEVLTMSLPL